MLVRVPLSPSPVWPMSPLKAQMAKWSLGTLGLVTVHSSL